ncbi:ABC transporter ATP-binding protein/permease [Lacimicrobium alkaliphilum]|uniref:ABC transporter ATP-binding protein n=1 Tax=Lacimicrobium alkaliphilum TaxID=1526571 RepID=A0A0U2QKS8_9ALTE|nr:ATP-binding cassette domain-containing protein [Lacimicrobium alkaliphilum]ALS97867.1 hypothetical protein AT746_06000 [Lacimicrobium alkaliphilum]
MSERNKSQEHQLSNWLNANGAAHRAALLLLTLFGVAAVVSQITLYWFLCSIAQTLIVEANPAQQSDVFSLGCAAFSWVMFEWSRQALSQRIELSISQQFQHRLHAQLLSGQYALVRQHNHFFWQQLWLEHIPAVAQYLVRYRIQQRMAVVTPLLAIILLFPVNWAVAAVLLVSMPVVPLFMYLIGSGTSALHQKHFVALERLGSLFADRLQASQLIHIHDGHQSQLNMLANSSKMLNRRTMEVVSLGFLSTTVLDFFSTLAVALVAVFVGFNLLGEIRIGATLSLDQGLFMLLIAPLCFAELKLLGRYYHQRSAAIAAAGELHPILNRPLHKDVDEKFNGFDLQDFESVVPRLICHHLSLNKGDWVQLQGDSGSGKSVLLECLMGQRPASHSVCGKKVLLTQHALITPATLRENLCLGHAYTDIQLWQSLEQVELKNWAETLADGLDTIMGERPPMSGGQKQRLALARALLTDAPLILLDEPTAHLTEAQHQRVSRIIRQRFQSRTLIWASHKTLPADWFNKHWQVKDSEVKVLC